MTGMILIRGMEHFVSYQEDCKMHNQDPYSRESVAGYEYWERGYAEAERRLTNSIAAASTREVFYIAALVVYSLAAILNFVVVYR